MEFSQIQKYAECVGWTLTDGSPAFIARYRLSGDFGVITNESLTPIRTRLAAKYRELAEQAQRAFETHMKLKYPNQNAAIKQEINQSHYLRAIADSLSEPEEPTQPTILQQLEQRRAGKFDPYGLNLILDALIELYKAKEMSK